MVKVKCPECEENFDIDKNSYDEGDLVECPECKAFLNVEVRGGKLVFTSDKEKYYGEDVEEFAQEEE
jgi:Zn finger protein HypA/HybF involved in hydrogenase expression